MKNKRISKYIFVSLILLAIMTIGYGIISSTLTIVGNTKIQKNSWIIYFDDVTIANDSVKNEDTNKDARITNTEKNNINFTAYLKNPGDFYEFTVYTVNDGTIDASIASIEKSLLSEDQQKYLTYEVKYDDGTEIKKCDVLKSNARRLIKAIVKFKDGLDKELYPTEEVKLNLFFRINYEQNTECEPTESTKKILTIRPNGGIYEGRTSEKRIYLDENEEYIFNKPTRSLYNFTEWKVIIPAENGTYTFENDKFTMGKENVVIEARWEEGNYVARIENTYYKTIQEAFNNVDNNWTDNTVYLLKNTEENPVNNANDPFIFDIGGYKLTGTLTNSVSSNITLTNGTIKAKSGSASAVVNNGIIKIGIDDGTVEVNNSIAIIGNENGLENNGSFYFYDGYLEGSKSAYIGDNTDKAAGHYIVIDYISEKDVQRAYLVSNPNRAVAKVTTGGEKYFYNLQSAIDFAESNKKSDSSLTDNDYIINIIRSFDASYELEVKERIIIDTAGYIINVGNTFENSGYLLIKDSTNNSNTINLTRAITNSGELIINSVNLKATTDNNLINNTGDLHLDDSILKTKRGFGISNSGNGTLDIKDTVTIMGDDNYAINNSASNVTISGGTIYGIYNTGSINIDGENTELIVHSKKNGSLSYDDPSTVFAVFNKGTVAMKNGNVTGNVSPMILNVGTFNFEDGNINATNTAITNTYSYISGSGTVNVNSNEIKSSNGPTIINGTVNLNGGIVSSNNGSAIKDSTVVINSGKVTSDSETSAAILNGNVTMKGGEIESPYIAANVNSFNIQNGKVTSENIGINASSVTISGGEINGTNNGIVTSSLNMTSGKVNSEDGTAITINNSGTITGGEISGKLYGVLSKGTLTLGSDDEEIDITKPVIKGDSYGLYIEGSTTNFYDGILKGEINGHYGDINGLPLGGIITNDTEVIEETTYNTNYLIQYENWLRIGNTEYNSINSASNAANDGDTIIVTKDVDVRFKQEFIGTDKNLIFDLNGHKISTMQTITNNSNVTIIDSSLGEQKEEDAGEETKVTFNKNTGIINNRVLTINAGTYESNTVQHIKNNNTLNINNATFSTNGTLMTNSERITTNGIKVIKSDKAIINEIDSAVVEINGESEFNSTTNVVDIGNRSSTYASSKVIVNSGKLISDGITINYGSVEVNGTEETTLIESRNNKAINGYYGTIKVTGGKVKSDIATAIESHYTFIIEGGLIEGNRGILHSSWTNGYSTYMYDITMTGGIVRGLENEGLYTFAGTSHIKDGLIEGKTYGVKVSDDVVREGIILELGENDGTIGITTPVIKGDINGVKSNGQIHFYDGIIKGKTDYSNEELNTAVDGLIYLIPDGSVIKEDFEYINRVEYKTKYVVGKANWLRVGNQEFNSINKAAAVIEETGTIEVIRSANVSFSQSIPSGKNITLDLNGYTIVTTQPIVNNGTATFIDSRGTGVINSLTHSAINNNGTATIKSGTYRSNDNAISNSGNMTYEGGNLISTSKYGVTNTGTFTMKSGTISTNGGIINDAGGKVIVDGGTIEGTNTTAINNVKNSASITVNGGLVNSKNGNAITMYGPLTVNGGTITSETSSGVLLTYGYNMGTGTATINGGDIIGYTNGIYANDNGNTMSITGGHMVGENNDGVHTSATLTITGGILEGKVYGAYAYGQTRIGTNDDTVSIDLPLLKGDSYGLYFGSNTINFYDGIFKGAVNWYNGEITNIPDRTEIFYDTEDIDEETYQIAYLLKESDIAVNLETEKIYNNLQDALDEANTGETVQLINNVPLYYSVTNRKNLTLDMNGKTISTNKAISNSGELNIINTSNEEALIKTSSNINLITSSNKLTLDNISIKNTSSSNYVLTSTSVLNMNNVNINSINAVNNRGTLSLTNSDIQTSRIAINNTGTLTINKGTYKGNDYSIYSNTSNNVTISEVTLNGTFYNSGNNQSKFTKSTINGNVQNNTSTLTIDDNTTVNGSLTVNSGKVTFDESTLNGNVGSSISNSGTLEITDSNITLHSNYGYNDYTYYGISNSGTLSFNNAIVKIDEDSSQAPYVRGISNSGTLNILSSNIVIGTITKNNRSVVGIYETGHTNMSLSELYVYGGETNYAVYLNNSNAKNTITDGKIEATGASNTFAVYAKAGTFEMGIEDGSGLETADVSKENPIVNSFGTRGIGIKLDGGAFNFYDGIINATRYSKPEAATLVEKNYEVTTYVSSETGYEYSWLEYIIGDYENSDAVARIDDRFFDTLELAVEKAENGEQIILLKSVAADIEIPSTLNVIIDLNNHSVTGKLINNGTLQVYNGSIQNIDDIALVNNGTLILGQNDENVSSTNIRIIAEDLALKNDGTVKMYDGYIEGNPSISGEINEIAEFSRIYTTRDDTAERKYLQSLSEDAIRAKETNLILEIDPNTGTYEEKSGIQYKYLFFEDTYVLSIPKKNGCDFVGWDVSDIDALSGTGEEEDPYVITIGLSDINIKAKWSVKENTVAKIGDEYYETLPDAIFHAKEKDTIELLKDVVDDITVTQDKDIILDLGSHKITGSFINLGILRIANGTIENEDGIGLINKKTLSIGYNDGEIDTEYVKIIGTNIGIQQDGQLNFYDGYIEGDVSLFGSVNSVPQGYFLYTETNTIKQCQRTYLIGNPANAVAVIEDGGTQYFFSLQDAIDTAAISEKEISIIRNFEASYPIEVKEDTNIVINMNSYNITTGNNITINGTLKIYDKSETKGSITSARTITNNGNLTIEDITISESNDSNNTILNEETGNLTIKNATIIAKNGKAIYTNGHLSLIGSYDLQANSYSIYINGETDEITSGRIEGIELAKDLTISGTTHIDSKVTAIAIRKPVTLTVNGGIIDTPSNTGYGIYNEGGSSTIYVNEETTINAYEGLYCNSGTTNYIVDGATITGVNVGARMQADNCHLTVKGGEITATNYGIYTYGQYNNINIEDGLIKGNTYEGIRDDRSKTSSNWSAYASKINITGGKVVGARHGIYDTFSYVTIENAEVTTTASGSGNYAIYSYSTTITELNDGAFLNSPSGSGLYTNSVVNINDGSRIYAGNNSGYGFYGDYNSFTMNGGRIEAPGKNAYGIYDASNYFYGTINDGEIISGNVGIALVNSSSNTRELRVYGGTIKGDTYGIYQTQSYTLTIGNKDDELSTNIPLISGGLYGIYKTSGTAYFYNGRLKGYTYGYNNMFKEIRTSKDIAEYIETIEEEAAYKTYSTSNISDEATKDYAKQGDGYARITYIGEDNGTCINNQTWDFNYTGDEQEFNAPCEGKFSLEVWGAQGGSVNSTYIGGYGGYSYGEVDLLNNETLYINVGGKGNACSGRSCTVEGGYNGGGASKGTTACDSNMSVGSGGGATHIAIQTGLLSDLKDSRDSILLVAGGGGSSNYCNSVNYASGGSGGGFIASGSVNKGARDWAGNGGKNATGGTQSTGFEFGKGQYNIDNNYLIGAGGGYYGGLSSILNGSGGGSGYIGNSRLSNKYMYGYNVETSIGTIVNNYLVEKDYFLQVEEEPFNNIDVASQYILDNLDGEGTITVIKDATIQENATFVANTNITFDLNGHTLSTTKRMYNNSNLTIVDSSLDKSGLIDGIMDDAIENRNVLVIDAAHIKTTASGNAAIYGNSASGSIELKEDSLIEGSRGILLNTTHGITMNNATINSSDIGIYINSHNNTININDSTITAVNYGIYNYGQNNKVTVTGGTVEATANDGIRFEYNTGSSAMSTLTLNSTTIKGARHGMYSRYTNVITDDSTITTTSTNIGHFAYYTGGNSSSLFDNNTIITAPNASAVYSCTGITLNGGSKISSGGNGGYAIRGDWVSVVLNDGLIEATGDNAYGISCDSNSYCGITINGGSIKATHIGIYYGNSTNNSTRFLNVYGGTIEAGTYGIYQTQNYTTTIGKADEDNSTTTPIITGGKYGLYKTGGTVNYYSGKLRGYTHGYYGEINNIRENNSIQTEVEIEDELSEIISPETVTTLDRSSSPKSNTPKEGNGYAKITYISSLEGKVDEITENPTIVNEIDCSNRYPNGKTYDFDYTGNVQELNVSCPGNYKVELWGAQGGDADNNTSSGNGNRGGYTSGNLHITQSDVFYIYVGQGLGNKNSPSFNGTTSSSGGGNPGGGATDIRLISDSWNNTASLASRIMVAAGGGSNQGGDWGGNAGGLVGYSSSRSNRTNTGGSQVSGGIYQRGDSCGMGSFGIGSTCGATGGGGYYGGSGANHSDGSGSGGSSFISGHQGAVAIKSNSDITPRNDSNEVECTEASAKNDITCSYHYSGYVFTDTKMIDGSGYEWTNDITTNKPGNPTVADSTVTEMGHRGNGYARVTYVSPLENVDNYSFEDEHYIELKTNTGNLLYNKAYYTHGERLGNLDSVLLLDNDSYVIKGWYLDQEYTKKVTEETLVYADATLYARVEYQASECLEDETFNFKYNGAEQVFNVTCPGKYKLELWGAQGGSSIVDGRTGAEGGLGSYSVGYVDLSKNETLYVHVGGKGGTGSLNSCANAGYNGGGTGTNDGGGCSSPADDDASGGGGGATHIATTKGLLSSLENNKDAILIVAGGGGGASNNHIGGSGGGYTGGINKYTSTNYPTQETGYDFGQGKNGSGNRQGSTCNTGVDFSCAGVAGGGGGFYGGYSDDLSDLSSGTGGSGYIDSLRLYDKQMYQYRMDTTGVWINNYLDVKEGYLQVGETLYNNFIDALEAIEETGTIIVLKDAEAYESINIPSSKNVTIDLKGHNLKLTSTITNNGTFKLTSSISNGILVNNTANPITNKGSLTIEDVSIKTNNYTCVSAVDREGSINIINSNLEGVNGIYATAKQTITLTSGNINTTSVGIYTQGNSSTITVEDGKINAGTYGIQNNSEKTEITVNGGTITAGSIAIYDSKSKSSANSSTVTINNGNIKAFGNGINVSYDTINIYGGEIECLGSAQADAALTCNTSSTCIVDGGIFKSNKASGIHSNATLTINDADIYSGNDSGYGINVNGGTTTINDVEINTVGNNSYGIIANNGAVTININNGSIKSNNVGIYLGDANTSTRTLNMYGGNIIAKTYGIYQKGTNTNTTIGDNSLALSITNPSIDGGVYGTYRANGTMSFYSGILKGFETAYSGTFNDIRENHEIFEDTSSMNAYLTDLTTYSINEHSALAEENKAKEGNGYARITYKTAESIDDIDYEYASDDSSSCASLLNKEFYFDSIGDVQLFNVECSGTYKLELWGAQGGYRSSSSYGGKGGYSSGYVTLSNDDVLHIYVGASGNNGGYNGGGTRSIGHGGGGASDIRINDDSLYSRIIVAGGGGSDGATSKPGGYGGGTSGQSRTESYGSGGNGASQTGAGSYRGEFGLGGSGGDWSGGHGGAGGGGWYGGGGVNPDGSGDDDRGGGGGSGFVYNEDAILPTGYSLDSKYLLTDTKLLSGADIVPSHDGTGTMVGNASDGFVKITYVNYSASSRYNVTLKTHEGTIENSNLVYRYNQELGEIPAPIVTDQELVFDGWFLDQNYTKKVTSTYKVQKNLTLYAKFSYQDSYCENLVNTTYTFDYTGTEQELFVKCPGTYTLEVWGAQGGNTTYASNSNNGGYGGYSISDITLNQNEILYINVGGQGQSVVYKPSESILEFDSNYGYNGGGYAVSASNNSAHGGGGGATHISTKSGLLSTLAYSKDNLLIVAGGGGGASTHTNYPSYSGDGGSGGGYTGGSGITANTTCYNYGTGGSQTSGGSYTACASDGRTTRDSAPASPTFGMGSNYTSSNTAASYAGGGSGYYGGQSGFHAPGGGGSGYNGNSRTFNKKMYGYNVEAKYDSPNTTIAYLITATDFIKNIELDRVYSNLQDAFDEAEDGNTLQLLSKASITYDTTLGDKKLILDLNGFEFVTTRTITNNGNLEIKDSLRNIEEDTSTQTFDYTGHEEQFVVPETGTYKLEVWGAQGGQSIGNSADRGLGGYGSYSVGTVELNKDDILYINVGGQGEKGVLYTNVKGGYNGGGNAIYDGTDDESAGGGGGATHIATISGLLSTLENNKDSILIVAGGGGGSAWSQGGHGGGYIGGKNSATTDSYPTQETGYAFGQGQNATTSTKSNDGVGGGGGGFYGGYNIDIINRGSGTGGSGYIGNTLLSDKKMVMYSEDTSYISDDSSTKTEITNKSSSAPISNYAKLGNGYVKITYVEPIDTYEFDYTGSEQVFTVPTSGKYKIETWGASGGSYNATDINGYHIENDEGYGGYSVGEISLQAGDKLYINVGGEGESIFADSSNYHQLGVSGGYNGGGSGGKGYSSGFPGGSGGGGATHVATTSGLLKDLSNFTNSIIIVSGGAGGSGWNSRGGSGGGSKGASTTGTHISIGGTQSTGYAFGLGSNGYNGNINSGASEGSGGSGGGYYGGSTYSTDTSYKSVGGAGGSGYIGNNNLSNKKMVMYSTDSSYISTNESDYTEITTDVSEIPTSNYAKKGNGYVKISLVEPSGIYEYGYTGDEQVFTVPSSGTYKIETWGAQGGGDSSYIGGYGGYSTGEISLSKNDVLYINVGGQGESTINSNSGLKAGGYNGGGDGYSGDSYNYPGGGGGATHVATTSGLLSTLEDQKDKIIIVSGGGGAGFKHLSRNGIGGSAGGYIGNSGKTNVGSKVTVGGSQTEGGAGISSGTFGHGGNNNWGTGGGSGFYGGGASHAGTNGYDYHYTSGAGGSSYIGNSDLSNKSMYCYDCIEALDVNDNKDIFTVSTTGNSQYKDITNCPNGYSSSPVDKCAKAGDGYVRITKISSSSNSNTSTTSNSKFYSNLPITLIQNNKTLTVNSVPLSGYNIISSGDDSTVTINNSTINSTNNAITTNGDLVITKSSIIGGNRSIYIQGSLSLDNSVIDNSTYGIEAYGETTLDNVFIITNNRSVYNGSTGDLTIKNKTNISSSSATAIENLNDLSIDNSNIFGSSYALYNNSSKEVDIEDTILKSNSNSLYNHTTGSVTVLDTKLIGSVTNNNASGNVEITNESLNGAVTNKGEMTIKNVEISRTIYNSGSDQLINNSGILTLNNNNLTYTNTYNTTSNDSRAVYNTGTLRSTGNNYIVKHNGKYKNLVGFWNGGLLTSTGDTIETINGYQSYGIYNNSSNTATISDININLHNYGSYAYGIQDYVGNITVSNSHIKVSNGTGGRGYNINNSSNTSTFTSTNNIVEVLDNTYSAGIIVDGGNMIVDSDTYTISGTNEGRGIHVNSGTHVVKDGTFTISGANADGVLSVGGDVTIEKGSFDITGTNAYGVNITNGTVTLGIYDGRGTEFADVLFDNPLFTAVGTTSGYGLSVTNGTFNYYDGKLIGSTKGRVDGSITSSSEKNYELKEYTDENTGYKYCILEYTR